MYIDYIHAQAELIKLTPACLTLSADLSLSLCVPAGGPDEGVQSLADVEQLRLGGLPDLCISTPAGMHVSRAAPSVESCMGAVTYSPEP